MNITIDPFDPKSISAAVALLERYEKDLVAKHREFVRRLAEIGVRVAGEGYSVAAYDGTNDVTVRMEATPTGYAVIAEGQAVGFIEFGTGIRNREWNGAGTEFTPPPHGSYGKGRGNQPWGWWFTPAEGGKGQHTYGNPPAEAMLEARNQMVAQVTQIAREVWK